jgi:hypothetical protein
MRKVSETADLKWQRRMVRLLSGISRVQSRRHTVSMRELEQVCEISRQTVVNWLRVAEDRGYVDLHNGQPRAIQLLPLGLTLLAATRRGKARC